MLARTAKGRKLPSYIVLQRKTMLKDEDILKGVHSLPEKGWMTEALIID